MRCLRKSIVKIKKFEFHNPILVLVIAVFAIGFVVGAVLW